MAPSSTTTTQTVTELKKDAQVANGANGHTSKADFFEDVHFLGDKEGKVVIRSPPVFDDPIEQRNYQKQHLAVAFRVFAKQGFDEGVAGHISLRDPINEGQY